MKSSRQRGARRTDLVERDGIPYTGSVDIPYWIREGAQVRVKTTPSTRVKTGSGVRVHGALSRDDSAAWAGEVGTVVIVARRYPPPDTGGTWVFMIEFSRGRRCGVDPRELADLVRFKAEPVAEDMTV